MFRFLGTLHFAIALIAATLLFVIAGTLLESWSDSHLFAAHLTYHNPIFQLLLWLYFINILFSALSRYPFEKRHLPFLMTHLGLLLLLGGLFVKNEWGVQGACALIEGEGTSQIFLPHHYALQIENQKGGSLIELSPQKLGKIETGLPDLELSLIEWLPHAEEKLEVAATQLIRSWKIGPPPKKREEATPRIRLLAQTATHEELITLSFDRYAQKMKWPLFNATYRARFQSHQQLIPHHLRLQKAEQINYPGTNQPYSYQAKLLIDTQQVTLSMNHVYEKEGYRYYLANLIRRPDGTNHVQIVVNHDPAKYWLTYPGALFLALGILLLYLQKRYLHFPVGIFKIRDKTSL